MTRHVVVTGGAGFIGSSLCAALLDDGHHVVCLDNLSSGRQANVSAFDGHDRFTFVRGDVTEPLVGALGRANIDPETVDRVYHLASRASPTDFDDYPLQIAETNSLGTHRTLEFARTVDARLLFASTSEVYGDPEVHPQHEEYHGRVDPRGDRGCYNEAKRFGETLVSLYEERYGFDARTVRIFNTYGPNMAPHDGRVIPNFLKQAIQGRDLTVYGDGTQTRCFLYVTDLVQGLRALMDGDDHDETVMNLGSTEEITIEKLAQKVLKVTDADIGITYEPLPHDDDPQRRRPDIDRARRELGWEPTTTLTDGLDRTYEYFAHELGRDSN